jgi:hypothetical protein
LQTHGPTWMCRCYSSPRWIMENYQTVEKVSLRMCRTPFQVWWRGPWALHCKTVADSMLMMFRDIRWAQLKICGNCEEAQAEASWLCTSFSFDYGEKSVDFCIQYVCVWE